MNVNIDLKKLSDERKERASALLGKAVPEAVSEGVYMVPSSDDFAHKGRFAHKVRFLLIKSLVVLLINLAIKKITVMAVVRF